MSKYTKLQPYKEDDNIKQNPLHQSSHVIYEENTFDTYDDTEYDNERRRDIEKIADDTTKVHQLFIDVHGLVQDGQLKLDNIETNVTNADNDINKGVVDIKEANKIQKAMNNRCCFFLLFLLLVIAGLVFFISYRKSQ